jgi:hypothetical protein
VWNEGRFDTFLVTGCTAVAAKLDGGLEQHVPRNVGGRVDMAAVLARRRRASDASSSQSPPAPEVPITAAEDQEADWGDKATDAVPSDKTLTRWLEEIMVEHGLDEREWIEQVRFEHELQDLQRRKAAASESEDEHEVDIEKIPDPKELQVHWHRHLALLNLEDVI